ncbi:MAG: Cof-type HAD-IIB family hydrolase [Tannerellaceae bacterium]|nr:Cof-type HAD-IIB family hydrolase [Tannerellaceae bacterium]
MVKAVFFDIDGTLVSFNTHQVPESTVKAIGLLREKGIKVFIATGRHVMAINNLGNLEFDGYITLNGSYCFAGKDEVIYKHPIDDKDIEALKKYQEQQEEFPCIFVQESAMYLNYKDKTVSEVLELLNFPEPPHSPLREIPQNEVFQLIAFFGEGQEERIMQYLPGCESTRWSPLFTDVVPAGGSKKIGIRKVLEYYNLSVDEIMAFGDGGNDMEMLTYAGTGIAMGNADDNVKRVADYVTDSVDEDGIYNALKHFGIL